MSEDIIRPERDRVKQRIDDLKVGSTVCFVLRKGKKHRDNMLDIIREYNRETSSGFRVVMAGRDFFVTRIKAAVCSWFPYKPEIKK